VSDADLAQALQSLLEAGERDPAEISDQCEIGAQLARQLGGDLAFRWLALEVRILLRSMPQDDSVAERYGELLEAARGDPGKLEIARALGDELRALQHSGQLPRTMVSRSPRRPRTQ
jgi:hypothetical protein